MSILMILMGNDYSGKEETRKRLNEKNNPAERACVCVYAKMVEITQNANRNNWKRNFQPTYTFFN